MGIGGIVTTFNATLGSRGTSERRGALPYRLALAQHTPQLLHPHLSLTLSTPSQRTLSKNKTPTLSSSASKHVQPASQQLVWGAEVWLLSTHKPTWQQAAIARGCARWPTG